MSAPGCPPHQLRRRLLLAGLAAAAPSVHAFAEAPQTFRPDELPEVAATPAAPTRLGEIPADFWHRPRELWLVRPATGESFRGVYHANGTYLPEGYWAACRLLRDVSANRMVAIDPTLLDVLRGIYGFYQAWRYHQPIVVTSAFRTAATNQRLRAEGAAYDSLHLHGRAVDLMVPGVSAADLGRLALHLRGGGVGFYVHRNFVHVDTGRVRAWAG